MRILKYALTSISIIFIFYSCATNNRNRKTPTYNLINNVELVEIIKDYIKRSENMPKSKETSYMLLNLFEYNGKTDTAYIFSLRNAFEGDLVYINQEPVIICDEIENKKIIVRMGILNSFVNGNIENTKTMFKKEHPNVYKEHCEIIKINNKLTGGERFEGGFLSGGRCLEIRFDKKGKFIDSTYYNYNSL